MRRRSGGGRARGRSRPRSSATGAASGSSARIWIGSWKGGGPKARILPDVELHADAQVVDLGRQLDAAPIQAGEHVSVSHPAPPRSSETFPPPPKLRRRDRPHRPPHLSDRPPDRPPTWPDCSSGMLNRPPQHDAAISVCVMDGRTGRPFRNLASEGIGGCKCPLGMHEEPIRRRLTPLVTAHVQATSELGEPGAARGQRRRGRRRGGSGLACGQWRGWWCGWRKPWHPRRSGSHR